MSNETPAGDPYATIAELYDLEHAAFADDLEFYVNSTVATGDPVLELGCGTGRLLREIARAGYRVTGVDRSRPMLDRAREVVAADGLGRLVTLHQGEMTDCDRAPGGPFGVVVIALNGFLHVADADEQLQVLAAARRALDPRGQLLIDVLDPTPDVLRAFDRSLVLEGTWRLDDGTVVDKTASRRLSIASQTIESEIRYELTRPDGTTTRVPTSFPMRFVYPSELALMLRLAGFAEWQLYGSYDLDPFDDDAERLIVAAEVTGSRSGLAR